MFFHFGSNTINLNHIVYIGWDHGEKRAEINMDDGTGWVLTEDNYLRLKEVTGYTNYIESRKSQD